MKKLILAIGLCTLVSGAYAQHVKGKAPKRSVQSTNKMKDGNPDHDNGRGNNKYRDNIDDRMKGPKGEKIYIGPRGGRYYLNGKGEKVHVPYAGNGKVRTVKVK